MKRSVRSFPSLRRLSSLTAVCVLALSAASLGHAAPVVLLRDNFNGSGTPNSGNISFNLSGRQSGAHRRRDHHPDRGERPALALRSDIEQPPHPPPFASGHRDPCHSIGLEMFHAAPMRAARSPSG